MTHDDLQAIRRENGYLKLRNSQLQDDVTALSGQVLRLQQELERIHGRRASRAPDPLAGGQS